jgi:hypothetical protein
MYCPFFPQWEEDINGMNPKDQKAVFEDYWSEFIYVEAPVALCFACLEEDGYSPLEWDLTGPHPEKGFHKWWNLVCPEGDYDESSLKARFWSLDYKGPLAQYLERVKTGEKNLPSNPEKWTPIVPQLLPPKQEEVSQWVDMVGASLHPIDWLILKALSPDEGDWGSYNWEVKSRIGTLGLFGLIAPTPRSFKEALLEGRVYVIGKSLEEFPWALALIKGDPEKGVPPMDIKLLTPGEEGFDPNQDCTSLYKKTIGIVNMPMKGKTKAFVKIHQSWGMSVMCSSDLFNESVEETHLSEEHLFSWLISQGGKITPQGAINLKLAKYYSLSILKTPEGLWEWKDSTKSLTRYFYGLNGNPIEPHLAVLLALVYITAGVGWKGMQGRKAFMSGVFKDEVTVGWSHPILDQFLPRKVGSLQTGMTRGWRLELGEAPGLLPKLINKYEKENHAVFLHKGGKYAVVDAEHTGFSRLPTKLGELIKEANGEEGALKELIEKAKQELPASDFETFVGWLADKLPKYTGRALWLVPTAAVVGEQIEGIKDDSLSDIKGLF